MSGRDPVEAQFCDAAPALIWNAAATGELVALTDDGQTPIVSFRGPMGMAVTRARSVVDLHGAHIGRRVVLMFEDADLARPIVMGVLRGVDGGNPIDAAAALRVEVESQGERVVVSASEQLVLCCGNASITLTKAGKVLIKGAYVSSRSSGMNRVKGGAVLLN